MPHTDGPEDIDVHCAECGYNLTGAVSGRCPECGWVIEPSTLAEAASPTRRVWRLFAGVTAAVVGAGTSMAVVSLLGDVRPSAEMALLGGLGLSAVVGYAIIAYLALRPWRGDHARWPLPRGDASAAVAALAGVSIVFGFALVVIPQHLRSPAALEYVMTVGVFTFPGWALLALWLASFRVVVLGQDVHAAALGETPECRPEHAPFVVDVFERYPRDDVAIVQTSAPRATSREIDASIDRVWRAALASAARDGKLLHDGELARLVDLDRSGSRLTLVLGRTTYREFVGTNHANVGMVRIKGDAYLANPLGVSVVPVTRDGVIVLGVRSDRVAFHAGNVHPLGGMVEAADRGDDGRYDVIGGALRELSEEIGVTTDEIVHPAVIGLIRDRAISQPELLVGVQLTLTRPEVARRFDAWPDHDEHVRLEFLPDEPDAVARWMLDAGPTTPVAEGAVLLHGRHAWGPAWFEQVCLVCYGELPVFAAATSSGPDA
ncbi:MAG: NUDIX hydrolase [Phycisphaerae bacterium]